MESDLYFVVFTDFRESLPNQLDYFTSPKNIAIRDIYLWRVKLDTYKLEKCQCRAWMLLWFTLHCVTTYFDLIATRWRCMSQTTLALYFYKVINTFLKTMARNYDREFVNTIIIAYIWQLSENGNLSTHKFLFSRRSSLWSHYDKVC